MQTPRFSLDEVTQLARDWILGRRCGWFSATSSSVDYVIYIFECSQIQAQNIILQGILRLQNSDFSRRILIWDTIADEYGLERYKGHNWYIKFTIEDNELDQISFHPCERDLILANGRIIASSIGFENRPHWRQ